MTDSDFSSLHISSQRSLRIRKLFPSIYIIVLGLTTSFLSLFLALLVGIGDPVDISVESIEFQHRLLISIIAFGVVFLFACIASAVIWLANKQWAKHLILALAIIGTSSTAIAINELPFLAACAPIIVIVLILADVVLVRLAYAQSPTPK